MQDFSGRQALTSDITPVPGLMGNVGSKPRAIPAACMRVKFVYYNPFHIVRGVVVLDVMVCKSGRIPSAPDSASVFTYVCAYSPCSHANIFELARALDHINHILAVAVRECS
ncbi:hypothetical protein NDU88_004687 [Pleurodeles waltl]|uniref:Uncharacterized protein n=1 Tax=Pleurodeles waltl TaxID=8319 RepID=A0AAV7MCE7_PLEWA|nr:hypothetical protein NDU88_004687 [Pleurodeles waltl]